MGAAIGAGTGLVGGYLYGKHKESEQAATSAASMTAGKRGNVVVLCFEPK